MAYTANLNNTRSEYSLDEIDNSDDLLTADLAANHASPPSGMRGNVNVAMPERIASGIAGAVLATYAIAKKRDVGGAALAIAGGFMLYRSLSGNCPAYSALRTGTNGATASTEEGNAVIPHGQGIKVEKTVTVNNYTAEELFDFWRNFENLPRFMAHLESVKVEGKTRSHWVAKGPFGKNISWEAEIINEVPGEMIAWRSVEPADIPNTGSVWFKNLPEERGTEVKVNLEYNPPAGVLGAAIAKIWGEEPNQQVEEDLSHFKSLMEAGEVRDTNG